MASPDITHLLKRDLMNLGYSEEIADELLDLGRRLGEELKAKREAEEADDPQT